MIRSPVGEAQRARSAPMKPVPQINGSGNVVMYAESVRCCGFGRIVCRRFHSHDKMGKLRRLGGQGLEFRLTKGRLE